jgi:membrane protease YdiL (CAAX protease family)
MQKKIDNLSLIYFLFLIILFLSGAFSGVLSTIVYFLAFIVPLVIGLYLAKDEENETKKYLTLDYEGVRRTLPIIAPAVSVVIILSALTSFVIYLVFGKTNNVDVGDAFIPAIIRHALIPAVLEELLFRYLPMRLLLPHSRRSAVLISAFFFALIHHDLFVIPYAFVAGVIFMVVDIAVDSVIPSMIIHFINNLLSVSLLVFKNNPNFAPFVYIALGLITILSLIDIIGGKYYQKRVVYAFNIGERVKVTPPMLAFAAITLAIAVLSLL